MTIIKLATGSWAIVGADGTIISEHPSNSQAWRALDRLQNEPINKREDTAEWVSRRI